MTVKHRLYGIIPDILLSIAVIADIRGKAGFYPAAVGRMRRTAAKHCFLSDFKPFLTGFELRLAKTTLKLHCEMILRHEDFK
jgi:hypothetical protein